MSANLNRYKVCVYYRTWAHDAVEALDNADIMLGGSTKSADEIEVWDEDKFEPDYAYIHPRLA